MTRPGKRLWRPVVVSALLGAAAQAAPGLSHHDAVALVAAHPAFEAALRGHPGWRAQSYATGNRYGVRRVQLWGASGEALGWADVGPPLGPEAAAGGVYSWETTYDLSPDLYRQAERALYAFLRGDPQVRALVGDPDALDKWLWYDSWRGAWTVHLERGPDSVQVALRSRREAPLALADLYLERIFFPHVLPYSDWRAGQEARAVTAAFAKPEVAARLRPHEGWRGEAEPLGAGRWRVRFLRGAELLAETVVAL